jgi:hypothetical protein
MISALCMILAAMHLTGKAKIEKMPTVDGRPMCFGTR